MSRFNTMSFEIENDFHEMNEQELKEHNVSMVPDSIAVYNSQNHTIISLYHKKINSVVGAIADKKTLRKRIEWDYKKANPTIEKIEEYETIIKKKKRYGFKYQYTIDNITFIGDVLSIIDKGHCYSINCNYREKNQVYGAEAMSKLLGTIVLD